MKKMKLLMHSLITLIFVALGCSSTGAIKKEEKYERKLQMISEMQSGAKQVNKIFSKFYPIALLDGKLIYLFEAEDGFYKFVKKVNIQNDYPAKIRAAFNLPENDFAMTCVVSKGALNKLEERILIYHEFVHCYQAETCEESIKSDLDIYQKAMAIKDYMWEINYEFPYDNLVLETIYKESMLALEKGDKEEASAQRRLLFSKLNKDQRDYLMWQEWKEGYARYTENQLREFFQVRKNAFGRNEKLSRISFYVGGELLINHLVKDAPELKNDLGKLWGAITLFGS